MVERTAVADRRDHVGHLQRCHQHIALPDPHLHCGTFSGRIDDLPDLFRYCADIGGNPQPVGARPIRKIGRAFLAEQVKPKVIEPRVAGAHDALHQREGAGGR